jgi:receptor-type tyrosine-protein phosphatase gamma
LFIPSCHLQDEENIPVKTITATAGGNLSISCPGVNEHSLIDSLKWVDVKTQKVIAKYINNGMPMVHNDRVS